MNQRYWNGHQWKDLPATEASVEDSPAAALAEPAAILETAATAEVPVVAAAAVSVGAIMVPTHAEYGDVFTAGGEV